MKNLVILTILKFWDRIFLQRTTGYFTFKRLAFEIANLSTMLDVLKLENPHIILSGKNSFNWIVVYLTALIKRIPLTLISHRYDIERKLSYINESRANIIFMDLEHYFVPIKNVHILFGINLNNFDLKYARHRIILNAEKKFHKWTNLNKTELIDRKVSQKFFKEFKSPNYDKSSYVTCFTSGVNNSPIPTICTERTILRAAKGMTRKLCKLGLRKKKIIVKTDFNFFSSVTFLPIMAVGGTIMLIKDETVKAIMANTQWYEELWDYVAEFMTERWRMYCERWLISKWINTIKLKKEFKLVMGNNLEKFIILNDETHFRLKRNLKRLGYEVISTYGTTKTAQLISIDNQLIKGTKIGINSENPTKLPGHLLVEVFLLRSFAKMWSKTMDMCSIGKDSELIVHGRKESKIITPDQHVIYPERLEKIVRSHE